MAWTPRRITRHCVDELHTPLASGSPFRIAINSQPPVLCCEKLCVAALVSLGLLKQIPLRPTAYTMVSAIPIITPGVPQRPIRTEKSSNLPEITTRPSFSSTVPSVPRSAIQNDPRSGTSLPRAKKTTSRSRPKPRARKPLAEAIPLAPMVLAAEGLWPEERTSGVAESMP